MIPDIVATTSLATLFATVGVCALAAVVRWRAARRPALLLGWAMLQQAVNLVTSSDSIGQAFGRPSWWIWTAAITTYFIAVPWALLVEHVVGRGWHSSVRRTCQCYLAFAIGAATFAALRGRPGAAFLASQIVVTAGALVGFLNLAPGVIHIAPDLRVLRAAFLAFLGFIVHDTLSVRIGILPWERGTGQVGLTLFVASLIYTVVIRTARGQQELQAIEQELQTARRIQSAILPAAAPALEGASIGYRYVPAAHVAGDMFEFLHAGPRAVGMLIADVSGHGVPAALIASMVKVAAAAQTPHADDPSRVLAGLHTALTGSLPPAHFVTAAYVYVDLERGVLRHASAGHPPALVRRASANEVEAAGPTGPLLIDFAPPVYPSTVLPLFAGDTVVLFTDGVFEAARTDGEMFGVERLAEAIREGQHDASPLLDYVIARVFAFAGRNGKGLDDDCTMVALRFEPTGVQSLVTAAH